MDLNTSIKVLLGSTLTSINKAKVSGKLCMIDLYLLNIVNSFINECRECSLSNEDLKKLEKLARDLQNSTDYICKIRSKPFNHTFKLKNKNINNFFGEMATFNLNIDGQTNLPPSQVGDGSKTTSHATAVTLVRADFTTNTTPPYSDPEGDAAELLKVLSLPSGGDLKLNGVNVTVNQIITFSDIDAGLLTYEPEPTQTNARVENFTFAIADAGSLTFTS